MDKIECEVCYQEFDDESSFHKHLRSHKLKIENYYYSQFPRYDKLTGQLIEFKNKDHYFSNDFNSKENLKKWFAEQTKEECINYIRTYLVNRKNKKHLNYAPCQVETRSLLFPAISTINNYIDYNSLCNNIGFISRFNFPLIKINEIEPNSHSILIDTREQDPFVFDNINTEIVGLKHGDYQLNSSVYLPRCVIERKSARDFIGTFSEGVGRFEREIERAEADNSYLVVVVEESLSRMLNFKDNKISFKATKINPSYLFRNIRDLHLKFKNLQFLFTANKVEASSMTQKLLTEGNLHNQDLQLLYDTGKL